MVWDCGNSSAIFFPPLTWGELGAGSAACAPGPVAADGLATGLTAATGLGPGLTAAAGLGTALTAADGLAAELLATFAAARN